MGANLSLNYSGVGFGSSGGVLIGDVMCLDAAGLYYVTATDTAIAASAAGTSEAISLDALGFGQIGAVRLQRSDVIAAGVCLGPGAASMVRRNSAGRLERAAYDSTSDWWGTVDALGNITIQRTATQSFQYASSPGPAIVYDPRNWGAKVDNIHDDLPAYKAMFAAIPLIAPAFVMLPQGMSYLSDDLEIARHIHIQGRGGGKGKGFVSGWRFPPMKGVKFPDAATSSDGGNGAFSLLEHVDIAQLTAIVMDNSSAVNYYGLAAAGGGQTIRVAGQFIEKGNWVVYSGATVGAAATHCQASSGTHNAIAFRALSGFTPSGSEPSQFSSFTTANIGQTITDGAGSWIVESVPKDWQASTAYVVGQRVIVPGDNRFVYECVSVSSDAKTGGAMPALFSQPALDGTTITDNHVVWKTLVPALVYGRVGSLKISHMVGYGGMGYAVHLDSGTGFISDFSCVTDLEAFYGGGGVHLHGGDANGIVTHNIHYYGQSTQQRTVNAGNTGSGEVGIWDRGQAGGTHIGCYPQTPYAPGYASDYATFATPGTFGTTGPTSRWIPAGNEGQSAYLAPGAIQFGDTFNGVTTGTGATVLTGGGCQNLVGVDNTGTRKFTNFLSGFGNGSKTYIQFRADNETQPQGFMLSDGLAGWPVGWMTWVEGFNASRVTWAVPGENAKRPDGTSLSNSTFPFWVIERLAIGPQSANPPTIDFGTNDPASLSDTRFFARGSVRYNIAPASGQPNGWHCTAAGSPGTWASMGNAP